MCECVGGVTPRVRVQSSYVLLTSSAVRSGALGEVHEGAQGALAAHAGGDGGGGEQRAARGEGILTRSTWHRSVAHVEPRARWTSPEAFAHCICRRGKEGGYHDVPVLGLRAREACGEGEARMAARRARR